MKVMIRICGAVSVGVGLLVASTAFAEGGFGGGHGGGGYGGYHGVGYYGGYHGGWGGPAVSFGFGGPYYYADYPPTYYYAPAPVVYSAPPAVVYTQPPVVYSQPADSSAPASGPAVTAVPNAQYQPVQSTSQKTTMTVADIKALAKGGLSDEVILSQIRSNHAVFNLSTEEIIDLNTSKVSQKVIDFMINTGSPRRD